MSDVSLESRPRRRQFRYDPAKIRGEEVFGEARRHSGLVRWLKIVLPALAGAAVLAFVLAIKMITSDISELFTIAGIAVDTKSLVMEEPHLSGFKGTEHSYEVHAERAVQDLSNPKIVRLEEIAAEFGLSSDVKVTLGATAGVFDGNRETLVLSDGITVSSTNGYAAKLEAVTVDFDKGTLTSDKPVEIRATSLDPLPKDRGEKPVEESKRVDELDQRNLPGDAESRAQPSNQSGRRMRVRFSGGVSLIYEPSPPSEGTAAAGSLPETE
jgi:lipopolysaccharide export system protein LptC